MDRGVEAGVGCWAEMGLIARAGWIGGCWSRWSAGRTRVLERGPALGLIPHADWIAVCKLGRIAETNRVLWRRSRMGLIAHAGWIPGCRRGGAGFRVQARNGFDPSKSRGSGGRPWRRDVAAGDAAAVHSSSLRKCSLLDPRPALETLAPSIFAMRGLKLLKIEDQINKEGGGSF